MTLHDSRSNKDEEDDSAHLKLERGEHTWEFSILIPSSTPTYERSPWGRVRHRVVARAKGLGKLGTEVTSVEQELMLVVNVRCVSSLALIRADLSCPQPGGAGASSPPPSLHARIEGTLDTVSPFGIELQSQHMMVYFSLFPISPLPISNGLPPLAAAVSSSSASTSFLSPTDLS